ncbi:MAG: hypothetical protein ABIP44_06045, partial [Pseudoxanthomonas sp.]
MDALVTSLVNALWAHQFSLTHALALALLHSLWQVALLAVLAALALALAEKRSAALRHALGMVFLLAMALLPVVSFFKFLFEPAVQVNSGLLP